MRRLLIRLFAVETALVGWLAYWLFLVYSNNPSVAQSLGSQFSRFPQLSFTTVDLTVLVIIGVLSLFLAFKFQRGLKPGIRLERALQMLENLMKRNLILEAQVAEMKLEKSQVTGPSPGSTPNESRGVSWEKAFRTPLEAGPAPPSQTAHTPGLSSEKEQEYQPVPHAPPPRIEPKAASPGLMIKPQLAGHEKISDKSMLFSEKSSDKPAMLSSSPSRPSTWEDSPKFLGETSGILTPSPFLGKPTTSFGESIAQRQPYIPAPPPKAPPSSAILGPGAPPASPAKPSTKPSPPSRFVGSPLTTKTGQQAPVSQGKAIQTPSLPLSQSSTGTEMTRPSPPQPSGNETTLTASSRDGSEGTVKPSKTSSSKKKFPWEDT